MYLYYPFNPYVEDCNILIFGRLVIIAYFYWLINIY